MTEITMKILLDDLESDIKKLIDSCNKQISQLNKEISQLKKERDELKAKLEEENNGQEDA